MIGKTIGPYQVIAELGVGGMGEVYRAHDSRLKRDVAIKVLPADVANDHERLARFQREAEVLASLNHPNIAHVYGLEVGSSPEYGPHLVMELVEGEDLSLRITRGPIPIGEALPIAKQLAEALEAAHGAGIVHRDLKPANIKIRNDGTVKVLDFGLAKALESAPGSHSSGARAIANSPTIASPAMTMHGVILGTASYMAPEQAKGRVVDRRADIWAFGCVVYEMLTGRRAFDGDDVTELIAAVVSKDPDWSQLNAVSAPPAVERLLRRCLVKDVKYRLPDIGVARLEIDDALTEANQPARSLVSSRSGRSSRVGLSLAMAALGLAAGWLASAYFSRPQLPSESAVRFEVDAADGTSFTQFTPSFIALSPAGRQLAYLAQARNLRNDNAELWVRSFADGTARKLATAGGVSSVFWAPDSSAVGFVANGRLQAVTLAGGTTHTIATLSDGNEVEVRGVPGAWSSAGVILFGRQTIVQVPAGGGTPTAVTKLDEANGEIRHFSPSFLPDGRRFLFSAYRRDGSFVLRLGELGSADSRVIGNVSSGAQYVEPGYLVYALDARLWARPFDARRGEWTGDPIVVADAVRQLSSGPAAFTTSRNGSIAFDASSVFGLDVELTWVSRTGTADKALATINGLHTVALNNSNSMLAVEHSAGSLNAVWLFDVVRGTRTRFTTGEATQGHPVWSPDGTRVAFFDGRPGTHTRLFIKPATGGIATEVSSRVNETVAPRQPTDWSRDGRFIVYEEGPQLGGSDLKYVDLTTGEPAFVIRSPANERNGQLSPDGRFIAYESNESGQVEIYVSTFPAADNRWTISNRGGTKPRWLKGGRELVFVDGDGMLQSVSIDASGGVIRAGIPVALFEMGAVDSDGFNYAPSSDGSKFLVMRAPAMARQHRVSVILNWPASLQRTTAP